MSWRSPPVSVDPEVEAAYAHCEALTRSSGSSFAAAFWMLPRERRRALHAIYAFCRMADDIADDPVVAGDRLRLLDRWRDELSSAYRGKATHPVGIALGHAVERFALPEDGLAETLSEFASLTGVAELAYLATCNRIELIFARTAATSARDLRPLVYELLTGAKPANGEAAPETAPETPAAVERPARDSSDVPGRVPEPAGEVAATSRPMSLGVSLRLEPLPSSVASAPTSPFVLIKQTRWRPSARTRGTCSSMRSKKGD